MRTLVTVTGLIPWDIPAITDAHNHLWIDSVPGCSPTSPVLNQIQEITLELIHFKKAGGSAIIDCQPAGCGRNALRLAQLSHSTGVTIISATGFHRPLYYPVDHWFWKTDADRLTRFFIQELTNGVEETFHSDNPIAAGFIKVACEETLKQTYQPALMAAANTASQTGRSIEIHTEKGSAAVDILDFFLKLGVKPSQIILCHMDKRPDLPLHIDIARSGAALEYDTFYRPKYEPENFLWPLLSAMVEAGWEDHICLATDMAEASSWSTFGHGPGLAAFPGEIHSRLVHMNYPAAAIKKLTGENIRRILSVEIESE